jgi:hypothetical protein
MQILNLFVDVLSDLPHKEAIDYIKKDENFLCGLELKEHDISLYLIYHPHDPIYFMYHKKELLFFGHDFTPASLHDWDSLQCVLTLLSFFLTKENDGSPEILKDYNEKQMAFVKLDHEDLRLFCNDILGGDEDSKDQAINYFKPFYFN